VGLDAWRGAMWKSRLNTVWISVLVTHWGRVVLCTDSVRLPRFWNFARKQPEEVTQPAADHLFGLCFVNDTMTRGADWAKGRVLTALSKYFAWDDDVVFHPYWNNQELISLEKFNKDKVVASLFTIPARNFRMLFLEKQAAAGKNENRLNYYKFRRNSL